MKKWSEGATPVVETGMTTGEGAPSRKVDGEAEEDLTTLPLVGIVYLNESTPTFKLTIAPRENTNCRIV